MFKSKFKLFSLGIVTEDIEEDHLFVTVYPIEVINDYNGKINDTEIIQIKSVDINGDNKNIIINKQVKLNCKWLPIDTPNRLTPPNVCKGETVGIYKYGESDVYFWSTIYNELDLRKREKATWVFSNKGKQDATLLDKVYFFTIDTINKFIRLHTDDSDGEFTSYDMEINTEDGVFTFQDGLGNMIELDSQVNILKLVTENEIDLISKNKIKLATKLVEVTCNDVVMKITNKMDVTLSSLSVQNNTAELIATLSDIIQAIIDEQHIGNLGILTKLGPGSISKFTELKSKIDSFKG